MSAVESGRRTVDRLLSRAFLPKFAAAFLAGGLIGTAVTWPSPHAGVLTGLFFFLALAALLQKMLNHVTWILILITALLMGLFLARQSAELEQDRWAQKYGPVDDLPVRILSDPYLEKKVRVELTDLPLAGRQMMLSVSAVESAPAFGQTIRVTGVAHGIYLAAHHWQPAEGKLRALSPVEQIQSLCLKIRDRIDRSLAAANAPPKFLAFARAELFGKRADLDPSDLRVLENHGLTHIIAVSGMHTSMLAAVLFFLLAPTLGKEAAGIITVVAVAAFTVIVGIQPAVVRAAIGTSLAIIGAIQKKPVRLIHILSACFVAEFMIFPEHLTNIGFQFSYLAVLAMALCAEILKPKPDPHRVFPVAHPLWIRTLLPLIMIQVFTAPLSAGLFSRWSILSVFSNLIFVPVFTLLIILAAAGAALALIWPALASSIFWIGDAVLSTTLRALDAIIQFSPFSSNYGKLSMGLALLFCAAWGLFLILAPRRPKIWMSGAAGFIVLFALVPTLQSLAAVPTLQFGGELTPFAVIQEGREVPFAYIHETNPGARKSLNLLVRDMRELGIHSISRIVTSDDVRKILKREFKMPVRPALEGLEQASDKSFRYHRVGLEVVYLRPASQYAPPFNVDFRAAGDEETSLLILESDGRGNVHIPESAAPDIIYVTGPATVDSLKPITALLGPAKSDNLLSAAVDGRLKLTRTRSGAWRVSTALQELLEE